MRMRRAASRRAGPAFGVVLVVLGVVAALTPVVPAARATDPTPESVPATSADPILGPETTASPAPTPAPSPDPAATPSVAPSATPDPIGLRVAHAWVDWLDDSGMRLDRGEVDAARVDLKPGNTYRVWFQVVNGTSIGLEIGASLEAASGAGAAPFVMVAAPDALPGDPFFVATVAGGDSRPRADILDAGSLRLGSSVDPSATAVDGLVSLGRNPAGRLSLPGHSFTEVGFTIRVTDDAAWGSSHQFRLTDGGVELAAHVTAPVTIITNDPVVLSGDQQKGRVVAAAVPLYSLNLDASLEALAAQSGPPYTSPHFDLSLSSDNCGACHASHTAQRAYLGMRPSPVSNICLTCHDGTGASSNVAAEYADPTVPADVPATNTWYAHPALATSGHTIDREDEFSGRLNRHAECADCHQPHRSDESVGVQTTAGWTASGAIIGASSVAVTNGAVGTAPTYAWQQTTTLEYQLCFKCHSGFTTLGNGARDKAIEFNPANTSYHPVEAAGTNQTTKMAASLSGTSPFKLWNFSTTGTVRCTHCHGNYRTVDDTPAPGAAARQAPHTSRYEGILIANYRREPKEQDALYDPADSALCLTCHGEAGILGVSSQTEFGEHGLHVASMEANGLASCAECHANVHSTADRNPAQTGTNSRLVVFGPTVSPYNGVMRWQKTGPSEGTCTLVCHGFRHNPENYRP